MTLDRRSLLGAAGLTTAAALLTPAQARAVAPTGALSPHARELSLRAYVDARAASWGNGPTAGDPDAFLYVHRLQTAVYLTTPLLNYVRGMPAQPTRYRYLGNMFRRLSGESVDFAGLANVLTRVTGFQRVLDQVPPLDLALGGYMAGVPELREKIDRFSFRTAAGPAAVDRVELRKLLYTKTFPNEAGGRAVVLDRRLINNEWHLFVNGIDLTALSRKADAVSQALTSVMLYTAVFGMYGALFAAPRALPNFEKVTIVMWLAISGWTLFDSRLRYQVSDLEDVYRKATAARGLPEKLFLLPN